MFYNLLIYIYIYDVSILKCVCNHKTHFYTYIYVYFTIKYYGVFKCFFLILLLTELINIVSIHMSIHVSMVPYSETGQLKSL